MKSDQLITQIETYSNALVAFVILQAIAYAYSFGTNAFFNCLVKTSKYLAHGLAIHFFIGTVLACYATIALRRLLLLLSQENKVIISRLYFAKCIIVALFMLLPFALTIGYGVWDYPSKADCKKTKSDP